MKNYKFPYDWQLSNGYPAKGVMYHGSKVFSCFAGGGSTMGYKLAGYDVVGMNEIDPRMAASYIKNHKPKYSFVEPIQDFKNRIDLPSELFDLDILDGSPPCSSFSMAGNREKDWGKKKKFAEGQAKQVLDTLFFDFLDLAERLQPKVIIAENVKGILMAKARKYSRKIIRRYDEIGYQVKEFVLNAANMGVPQRRERVFFIGIRKDLACQLPQDKSTLFDSFPLLDLRFNERKIPFRDFSQDVSGGHKNGTLEKYWDDVPVGRSIASIHPKGSFFSYIKVDPNKPLPTLNGSGKQVTSCLMHPFEKRYINEYEMKKGSAFPIDYKGDRVCYIVSMSVPPVMTAQIACRIYEQWIGALVGEIELVETF